MPPDTDLPAQLARARTCLDEWRALPVVTSSSNADEVLMIAQERQKIAAELGRLYQNMKQHPSIQKNDLAALLRAIAVMRETVLIDLHLINGRANYVRTLLSAHGEEFTNTLRQTNSGFVTA